MQLFNKTAIRQQLKSYLELGLNPIPLKGKVANYHWKSFTLTESSMDYFIKPGINWALRTGLITSKDYFYVVDLDSKGLLSPLYEALPGLMGAPLVSTARGFHIYLTWIYEVKTRHFLGIDIIGNGYVCAPPSIHPGGHRYKFLIGLKGIPLAFDPYLLPFSENAPPIVHDFPEASAEEPDTNISLGVPEGQRHNALVRYLGILYAQGFLEEEALSIVTSWNKFNFPPLPQSEVDYTVSNCWESWETWKT